MKDNREPPEKKSRVLTQILKEIDSEKKTNTPKAWGNWNNWGNWGNWVNWVNWWN